MLISFVRNWGSFLLGEEADVASGLVEPSSNPMETAILAREQVNNLMERFVYFQ